MSKGERGCGSARTAGSIYLEVATSPFGMPLDSFLVDPPIKVDLDALGVSPLGTHVIQAPGEEVYNIIDVVGSEHYTNVADFYEEGRVMGFSRKSSLRTPAEYAKLTPESRIMFLHRRACIENFEIFKPRLADLSTMGLRCPRGIHSSLPDLNEMCVCLYWADIEFGKNEGLLVDGAMNSVIKGKRKLPCDELYTAYDAGLELDRQYHYGLFLSLPLGRIVLVDPAGQYQDKLGLLRDTTVPVEVVDE